METIIEILIIAILAYLLTIIGLSFWGKLVVVFKVYDPPEVKSPPDVWFAGVNLSEKRRQIKKREETERKLQEQWKKWSMDYGVAMGKIWETPQRKDLLEERRKELLKRKDELIIARDDFEMFRKYTGIGQDGYNKTTKELEEVNEELYEIWLELNKTK